MRMRLTTAVFLVLRFLLSDFASDKVYKRLGQFQNGKILCIHIKKRVPYENPLCK